MTAAKNDNNEQTTDINPLKLAPGKLIRSRAH
jgi:hypothetical protein